MRKKKIFKTILKAILSKLYLGRMRSLIIRPLKMGIINKGVAKALIDFYDGYWGQRVDRDRGNLGYGFVHYALIIDLKPKRVLCIGSHMGFIPAICTMACRDNQFGHIDFIDAGFKEPDPRAAAGVGFWKECDPKKHFSLLGVGDWITTYVMTSDEFAKKYPNRRYDYIYIDGDHSYEGVKLDYQLFWPRLKKGGFMVFHDISPKGHWKGVKYGVWKLWRELGEKHKIFLSPEQDGLGILQKV